MGRFGLSRRAILGLQVLLVLVVAAGIALIPVLDERSFNLQRIAFNLLWYAILASAWNIIGGYAGQISFGHAAFLGIGAYVTGILWSQTGVDPLLTLPVAGLVAASCADGNDQYLDRLGEARPIIFDVDP